MVLPRVLIRSRFVLSRVLPVGRILFPLEVQASTYDLLIRPLLPPFIEWLQFATE